MADGVCQLLFIKPILFLYKLMNMEEWTSCTEVLHVEELLNNYQLSEDKQNSFYTTRYMYSLLTYV
jgi:hypothetical protein